MAFPLVLLLQEKSQIMDGLKRKVVCEMLDSFRLVGANRLRLRPPQIDCSNAFGSDPIAAQHQLYFLLNFFFFSLNIIYLSCAVGYSIIKKKKSIRNEMAALHLNLQVIENKHRKKGINKQEVCKIRPRTNR